MASHEELFQRALKVVKLDKEQPNYPGCRPCTAVQLILHRYDNKNEHIEWHARMFIDRTTGIAEVLFQPADVEHVLAMAERVPFSEWLEETSRINHDGGNIVTMKCDHFPTLAIAGKTS